MPAQAASAIDELIERHADRAYAAAYRLTGNAPDAWDLVQEAFIRALEKAPLYDPALDFGPWLHRLLYRVFLNRRRDRGRLRELALEPDVDRPDGSDSPERAFERDEEQARVEAALAGLPDDLRACVVLVDMEGCGYEEAAGLLGWPVGSVSGRLFRAQRLLRRWLERREGGGP